MTRVRQRFISSGVPDGGPGRAVWSWRVIFFDQPTGRFNFRVAGVAYAGGRVLLQRVSGTDFWFLPGGRVEMLESAQDALRREIREELGMEASVGRLLWVAENFFAMQARQYHELGLYFAMDVPASLDRDGEFPAFESSVDLHMRWLRLDDLPEIRPAFLRQALREPPASTAHIVFHDAPVPLV
jgi:8-oxo-dGTP pyrophosphatase MutT (NUDIX family)